MGRLAVAASTGALIGLQREFGYIVRHICSPPHSRFRDISFASKNRGVAGLRTHMLVSIASCLFTVVSQHGFTKPLPYSAGSPGGDPARIAAQIVSGVGFLGAGTIVKSPQGGLSGLTTAASIWTAAALGIASGSEVLRPALAFIAVAFVVCCLQVVILLEDFIHAKAAANALKITAATCTLVCSAEDLPARIQSVLATTAAKVGAVRDTKVSVVSVPQPGADLDQVATAVDVAAGEMSLLPGGGGGGGLSWRRVELQLKVAIVPRCNRADAFVQSMQVLAGFQAATIEYHPMDTPSDELAMEETWMQTPRPLHGGVDGKRMGATVPPAAAAAAAATGDGP
eukprot:COSAG01_NODE_4678_length_4822_cov_5.658129_5_plen_341_part_00